MAAIASEKVLDPTASPPATQSMDDHSSSRRFSDTAASDATEASDRPPSLSHSASSPSPSRELEIQMALRSEEYRQLFRLPPDEVLIQDFNCALQENFLLQGHMYLFVHYICFYSNLFGFETKRTISFNEVTSVRRAKAAAIFPTAIEITAGEKKYFFTSFLSRDEAFKIINEGWLQHGNGSKEIADQLSEISSQEAGNAAVEEPESSRQSPNELEDQRERDVPVSDNSKPLTNGEPEIIATSSQLQVIEEGDTEAAQNVNLPSSAVSSVWEQIDSDAPRVPECYMMVAEAKFPIKVKEFFHLFFSDEGVNYQELFHDKCGDKEFTCTKWHHDEKLGHSREVRFQHPIKLYFGGKFGSCHEVQKYRVYRNCHLVVETSQEINDVPYGDYFRVEGLWDVERDVNDSKPGCILRVYVNVAFSKKTIWKGKIVQSTIDECRDAYAIWIELAHELLKKKNLKTDEAGGCTPVLIPKDREKQVNAKARPEDKASDARISQALPDLRDANQQVLNPSAGNLTDAVSADSFFRDSFVKLSTSLKQQNPVSLLLIITFVVILLLMQISILVLLSRPQRIHVIPQGDCMSSMLRTNGRGSEVLALLDEQIKNLKEEMRMVETLLEKMRHEHAFLSAKLKDLELFRKRPI